MAKSKQKILEDARKYINKGKLDKAVEEYEALFNLEPDDPGPLNNIGDLYTKMGKIEDAIEYHQKAIHLYNEIGLFNNAIAVCKKILRADPNRVDIYKALGESYREQGLTNDAIKNFVLYADKMREKGNVDEVLFSFKNVVELSPKNIEIRVRLSELYMKQGHKDEAIEELFEVVRLYEEKGDMEKADEARAKIAEIDPNAVPPVPKAKEEEFGEEEEDGNIEMPADDEEEISETSDGMLDFTPSDDADLSLPSKTPSMDNEEAMDDEGTLDSSGLDDGLEFNEGALDEDAGTLEMPTDSLEMPMEDEPLEMTDSGYSDDDEIQDLTDSFSSDYEEEEVEEEISPAKPAPVAAPKPVEAEKPKAFDPAKATVEELKLHLSHHPDDASARYQLGLKLLKTNPDEAIDELMEAGDIYHSQNKFPEAIESYNQLLELAPNNLLVHKKMLESASTYGEVKLLIRAYLRFGDALADLGEGNKAEFVYQKVLGIDANNADAMNRINNLKAPKVKEKVAEKIPQPVPVAAPVSKVEEKTEEYPAEGAMVDLDALLSDSDDSFKQKTDKIKIERKDFDPSVELDDIISDFKAGVQEQYEDEDYDSHYDLGLAYKEMGLVDEAISEFQIATRGSKQRLKAFEMLGQCFLEKNDYDLALKQFKRGIATPGHSEFEYLGLHYNVGLVNERLKNWEDARKSYEEVYVVDIGFRDIAERISFVQKQINN